MSITPAVSEHQIERWRNDLPPELLGELGPAGVATPLDLLITQAFQNELARTDRRLRTVPCDAFVMA